MATSNGKYDELTEDAPLLNSVTESIISTQDEMPRTFWKNLIVTSLSFFLIFTAFLSIQNLESSLNHSSGLGVVSLACIYGSVAIACLFAPAIEPILLHHFYFQIMHFIDQHIVFVHRDYRTQQLFEFLCQHLVQNFPIGKIDCL